ncbi:MAG: hypothetical protein, partial [Olavius algarvensis Gamma 1 endosymbiont]
VRERSADRGGAPEILLRAGGDCRYLSAGDAQEPLSAGGGHLANRPYGRRTAATPRHAPARAAALHRCAAQSAIPLGPDGV